jgi:hypothetical protein
MAKKFIKFLSKWEAITDWIFNTTWFNMFMIAFIFAGMVTISTFSYYDRANVEDLNDRLYIQNRELDSTVDVLYQYHDYVTSISGHLASVDIYTGIPFKNEADNHNDLTEYSSNRYCALSFNIFNYMAELGDEVIVLDGITQLNHPLPYIITGKWMVVDILYDTDDKLVLYTDVKDIVSKNTTILIK